MKKEIPNISEIDFKKLKEEDRRLLLQELYQENSLNSQGALTNGLISLAVFTLFVSAFALVLSTKNLPAIIIFSLFSVIIIVIYLTEFKKAQSKTIRWKDILKKRYEELFKFHFDYAKRKK